MSGQANKTEDGTAAPITTAPGARRLSVDPERQFQIVSLVALAVAAPFIVAHLLIGVFAFPFFTHLLADVPGPLPWASAFMLSVGWIAGPILVLVDLATFWLLYRLSQRWWIGLLFVPIFVYLMMSAFIAFLLYVPLFPLLLRPLS
jgi:hypothetical protein